MQLRIGGLFYICGYQKVPVGRSSGTGDFFLRKKNAGKTEPVVLNVGVLSHCF